MRLHDIKKSKSLDTIREIRDSGKEKPEIYEIA